MGQISVHCDPAEGSVRPRAGMLCGPIRLGRRDGRGVRPYMVRAGGDFAGGAPAPQKHESPGSHPELKRYWNAVCETN
jgi:hypothetical protein